MFERPGRIMLGVGLMLLGLVLAASAIWLGFEWAPTVDLEDMNDPYAQRIFYWHVSVAWSSFVAFAMLFVGSLAWFWKRLEWGWRLHACASELGLLYGLMVITSGPIWAQAEWGTPWDWTDVRLNSYALLTSVSIFLVLSRRAQPDGVETRDSLSAIGLFGFALVPLTFISTRIWQIRHPGPVIATEGGMTIEVEMLIVLLIAFIGFTFFLIGQLTLLWDLHSKEERMEVIAAKLDRRVTSTTN